ncbi:MAG: alanine--tRNA ligase [Fimbriimonadaceae bacterium]|nr:MAG: alanine--tRNA ligase [Fimbriimonadaceae bacterium]
MTPHELRRKYLDFFISKGHAEHASGSLIPYDVTGRLDESLLFNGAGMVQFKPYFRGVAEPPTKRLATSQKCFRTGDIEEVGDTSHLTFFEMLGNFSFGDYFKTVAIAYSWEFLTSKEWLGLDPTRLSFTVFSEDDEAYEAWSKHLSEAGIEPATRIFRLGEDTNYWPAGAFSKGPPGPCGPNSEMFYWTSDEPVPTGTYTAEDYLRDEGEGKWLEIWNDVFIQFEWQGELKDASRPDKGFDKVGMPNLPFQSVDTGMGIERTIAVLGGFKSVYDTAAFTPLLRKLEEIGGGFKYGESESVTRAMRIIADHVRGACFCIADGVLPSNTGRGYVLRRLIRRAVLKGARGLGFGEAFLWMLAEVVVADYSGHYRELADRRDMILETLRNEEALFRRTLGNGLEQLIFALKFKWLKLNEYRNLSTQVQVYALSEHRKLIESSDNFDSTAPELFELSGEEAFQLYDTYGFPLEVTQEICAEAGVTVDTEGYRTAMLEAQERSRASAGMDTVYGGVGVVTIFATQDEKPSQTEFIGYTQTTGESIITGAHPVLEEGKATNEFVIALESTPFYAESGGQVADTGVIYGNGFTLNVKDVTKSDGIFVHLVELSNGSLVEGLGEEEAIAKLNGELFKQVVECEVDAKRRAAITRNHTATHLMHAALRQVLGTHVTQAGSLVNDEILRFDFTHGAAMSDADIKQVEEIVYGQILASQGVVTYTDVPIDEARAMGAMALFGEKYADFVRVVQIGEMPPSVPSFSRELCGGVHVRTTGEIGLFKIAHESSAASGVRRITAVTGTNAFDWVSDQQTLIQEAANKLKTQPRELAHAIEKTLETLREERKKREKLAQSGVGAANVEEHAIGAIKLKVQTMNDAEAADAKLVADRLVDGAPDAVALIANIADGKVTFVCKVGESAQKSGAKAGDIVREVAKIAGGGGGGRPDFATAGGRDVSQVPAALAKAQEVLASL